ncbi:hypothetical protein HPB50_022870 [Hyalomma asiaticum]|uniref:Uncharacterized protein n=1 Tax=Hyalomma asiaticum TaxID=266040 RepID=A0ACB7T6S4_HYAAI|nr:hypothetical protein HPB50_022870 [Hyalomma asiaticum]
MAAPMCGLKAELEARSLVRQRTSPKRSPRLPGHPSRGSAPGVPAVRINARTNGTALREFLGLPPPPPHPNPPPRRLPATSVAPFAAYAAAPEAEARFPRCIVYV